MPEQKKDDFVVSDRRRFSIENDDVKPAATEAEPETPAQAAEPERYATLDRESGQIGAEDSALPEAPSADAQQAGHDAYNASNKALEEPLKKATGREAKDFEMSFERLCVSLYMTAMMQLGLLQEEGQQPMQPDLIGARQTIDTLGILNEKTKGNLTEQEQRMLQGFLYELRMTYVQFTNAITRGPQGGGPMSGPQGGPIGGGIR
jgi:hypothetical protein